MQTAIQSQIEVIKKATQIASASKEAALKFLVDAGIINQKQEAAKSNNTPPKIER